MKSTHRLTQRWLTAVSCIALFTATTLGAPSRAETARWPRIVAQLSRLPTVTGQSVLARAKACGITLHRRQSHLTKTKGGDELWIPVTIPNGPGDHYLPIVLSWMLKDGQATPTSSWAQKLQEMPGPLGFEGNMQC